ncbi:MAG: M56 family metallopeptidase [Oscillospiraceae bacterium]|nr:M56 family metallopeptidase [Oscillospiraceae bacterium]
MDRVFLTVLNMSLTGAFVIAVVCLARLLLHKAPKKISYCLWVVAAFRLVCPFSIESAVSFLPFNAETIPPALVAEHINRIDSGIARIDEPINTFIGQMGEEWRGASSGSWRIYPLRSFVNFGAYLWLIGAIAMAIYGAVSYLILKRKMQGMAHIESNIYESEIIESPFVLGIFNPHIYLPVGLSEKERGYIVLHEQTHIKRRDYIIKLAAYFILCLHWFNPLAWAAFLLMGVDMEMSCDERVLREMGGETKKDYTLSLLSLATERHFVGGSPLAFGEGGVKGRIKRVINFSKPSRVVIVVAIALVAVLIAGFTVNRANNEPLMVFEAIYSNVDEYGFSSQFKRNDIMYSPYIDDDFYGGTRGLKEIGFAVGDFSGTVREGQRYKYRIFERNGYSIDEFIIVKDDGFMNPAIIYAAVKPDVPDWLDIIK